MQESTSITDSKTIVSVFDAEAACTLAVLVQDEMIPAEIIASGAPLRWDIKVPSEFFEPALRLWREWKPSDAELAYLATGALGNSGNAG
jgi:hypothetical protein